MLKGFIASSSL